MRNLFIIFCGMLLFSRCQKSPAFVQPGPLAEIAVLCEEGGMPNLFVSEKDQLYISWIEYLNDTTDALYYSEYQNQRWSTPRTIATGADWFANWADFPSLAVYRENHNFIAAHWLQKSAAGTYDYDVRIAISQDNGRHWQRRFTPHRDSIAAEHGFVSLVPLSGYRMFAAWLDGRHMKSGRESGDAHGHAHSGPMTLRSAIFDTEGVLEEETELDDRVCECCQTDAVLTKQGLVVVYRDRDENEIRDISIVRKVRGQWMAPRVIYQDNWKIAGCPVNGPAVAAWGDTVAVAWYSAPEDSAQVKVAFSFNAGETFEEPVRIDLGNPLGRVDVVMFSGDITMICWMENRDGQAMVMARQVRTDGTKDEHIPITMTSPQRQSGFPVMEKTGDKVVFAWTHADSAKTIVKTAMLQILR